MSWFTDQRLTWIKETIHIFGFIRRRHIERKFGVSTVQASNDIRDALVKWPNLMVYDKSLRAYVAQGGRDARLDIVGDEHMLPDDHLSSAQG